MRSIRPWLILGLLAAASGCTSATPAPADTAADEAAIKAQTNTWMDAYNAGDADQIAALYADDAVLMPPHAPVAKGKAVIRDFVAKDAAAAKTAGVKLVNKGSDAGVSGDLGWESGSYTVTDGSGKVVDSGSYMSISKKVDGKWLYYRDTYNSDQPLPAPAAPAATK